MHFSQLREILNSEFLRIHLGRNILEYYITIVFNPFFDSLSLVLKLELKDFELLPLLLINLRSHLTQYIIVILGYFVVNRLALLLFIVEFLFLFSELLVEVTVVKILHFLSSFIQKVFFLQSFLDLLLHFVFKILVILSMLFHLLFIQRPVFLFDFT